MAILIAIQGRPRGRPQEELLDYFYRHVTSCQTYDRRTAVKPSTGKRNRYPSFAVMEIFAFSTFDTGQPFSAASAYF
jgi:hypothetical protein